MKSTKHTIQQRLEGITELLLKGVSRRNIIQYCSDTWSVGERQADNYIAKARRLIEESVVRSVAYDYSVAVRRYENLFEKAVNEGDGRLAVTVLKELTAIQGLHKQQTDTVTNINFINNLPE